MTKRIRSARFLGCRGSQVENGLLKVRNRIYATVFDADWVQEHMPDAENRRQKAAYRRGVYRASAIVGSAVIVVGGLALYGFSEARIARTALGSQAPYVKLDQFGAGASQFASSDEESAWPCRGASGGGGEIATSSESLSPAGF